MARKRIKKRRRRIQVTCHCGGYWFPHRLNSMSRKNERLGCYGIIEQQTTVAEVPDVC